MPFGGYLERTNMSNISYIFVMVASVLWGMIGFFVNRLYNFGFEPIQAVFIRVTISAAMLVIYLLLTDKKHLKIKFADIKYFIGTGIISLAFFNWCLFVAIKNTSLSVATILLYTAPAFVTILSTILFKEKLTVKKVVSLGLTFIGCIFVTGYLQSQEYRVSLIGIISGLGSGIGYALYSIFSKYALKKYPPMTITAYTFIVACIWLIPISNIRKIAGLFSNTEVVICSLALALVSTVLPFIFYTKGLSNLETSKASIIATLEPVVASVIGFTVFNEKITLPKIAGILLVIIAIIIIRDKKCINSD
jgi:drug/metabolite transporter (DMT)-like permease